METKHATRTKCEIWTRVMGYHRPVSQYNHGKKSEFYSRVYFKAVEDENLQLLDRYSKAIKNEQPEDSVNLLLFTTTTCPKCPAVKNWLNESGKEFFSIDNTMLNFSEIAQKYRVYSVPTLIAVNKNGKELWRANELSQIKQQII